MVRKNLREPPSRATPLAGFVAQPGSSVGASRHVARHLDAGGLAAVALSRLVGPRSSGGRWASPARPTGHAYAARYEIDKLLQPLLGSRGTRRTIIPGVLPPTSIPLASASSRLCPPELLCLPLDRESGPPESMSPRGLLTPNRARPSPRRWLNAILPASGVLFAPDPPGLAGPFEAERRSRSVGQPSRDCLATCEQASSATKPPPAIEVTRRGADGGGASSSRHPPSSPRRDRPLPARFDRGHDSKLKRAETQRRLQADSTRRYPTRMTNVHERSCGAHVGMVRARHVSN